MRFWSKNSLTSIVDTLFIKHRSPIFLGYLWNFGVFSFLCLFIQIFTGLFLTNAYVPDTRQAFASVEHIMRDVNNGWFLAAILTPTVLHSFLLPFTFICSEGFYYGSFANPPPGGVVRWERNSSPNDPYRFSWLRTALGPNELLGSHSYYKHAIRIPVVGKSFVSWVWGATPVGGPTLPGFTHFTFCFLWC